MEMDLLDQGAARPRIRIRPPTVAEDFQMKVHESPLKRLVMVQHTAEKQL